MPSRHLAKMLTILITGAAAAAAEPPTFLSAYYHDSEVCFDAPIPVDWERLARQHFTRFSLSSPDERLIRSGYREIYGGTSSFPFPAPLPPEVAALHYYVFTEEGVEPFTPSELRGQVRYTLDRQGTIVAPPDFFGQVCGRAGLRVQDAGVVAFGAHEIIWRTAPAAINNRQTPPSVHLEARRVPVPETKYIGGEIRAAYVATTDATPATYLFVRRSPDSKCERRCCTHSYQLFRVTSGVEELTWTAYDCDS